MVKVNVKGNVKGNVKVNTVNGQKIRSSGMSRSRLGQSLWFQVKMVKVKVNVKVNTVKSQKMRSSGMSRSRSGLVGGIQYQLPLQAKYALLC